MVVCVAILSRRTALWLSAVLIVVIAPPSATASPQRQFASDFGYPLDPDNYGYSPPYDGTAFLDGLHPGEDWNNALACDSDYGHSVSSIANGIVRTAQDYDGDWGNVILIEHQLPDGTHIWSQYAHLSAVAVQELDYVEQGEYIGDIGKGGWRCAHLHWEVRTQYLPANWWPADHSWNKEDIGAYYTGPSAFVASNGALDPGQPSMPEPDPPSPAPADTLPPTVEFTDFPERHRWYSDDRAVAWEITDDTGVQGFRREWGVGSVSCREGSGPEHEGASGESSFSEAGAEGKLHLCV